MPVINVWAEEIGREPWEVDLFVVGASRMSWNGCGVDPVWGFFTIAYQKRLRSDPEILNVR